MLPIRDNIPTRRFPVVTVAIMVICIAVFFGFQQAHWDGGGFAVKETRTVEYAYIPYEFTHMGKECELSDSRVLCEGKAGVTAGAEPRDQCGGGEQPAEPWEHRHEQRDREAGSGRSGG